MASFDIVSELNMQEVDNAINQAKKEMEGRYDFKGAKAELNWDKKVDITILADDDYKLNAIKDILQTKMHRRGIDIRALKFAKEEEAGSNMIRQKATLQAGIEKEVAKDIIKSIKDSKIKVQAQIMDDKIRVTSKSIDSLQECMTLIKGQSFAIPLQFDNMRS